MSGLMSDGYIIKSFLRLILLSRVVYETCDISRGGVSLFVNFSLPPVFCLWIAANLIFSRSCDVF